MKPPRTLEVGPRVTLAFVLAALAAACGADNAVVGGSCAAGYTQCDLVCVDTTDDPDNCGRCGNVCHGGACVKGACPGTRDASPSDGSGGTTDGGTVTDGRTVDVVTRDVETDATGASCTPPFDTNDNCGACGLGCSNTEVCVLGDAGTYGCTPLCSPPTLDCGGACVDTTDDPNNCSRCGKVCPSGFCAASACEGTTEGDIVVIGDDYHSTATVPSADKVLTNAVFLPTSSPVELLSFEHYADPDSVSNVKGIVNAEATLTGRKVDITVSNTDTDVPNYLTIANYDVLLVYDQEGAGTGVLGALGASWMSAVSTFTSAGGIVVSLDGAAGTGEMPEFDTSAGLLAVSAHTVIATNVALDVLAGGDAIGHGVVGPYAAKPDSVFFTTSESNGGNVTYVVVDPSASQAPVVVHKEVP
jgi:hypothetical protein